jgi:hypothetical protein
VTCSRITEHKQTTTSLLASILTTAEEASTPRKILLGMRCILQESLSCQVREDHQGRFRKLQAESLPRLVSLALFLSGNCGLPRSIFSTGRTALRCERDESPPWAVGESDDSRSLFLYHFAVESLTVLQTSCIGLTLASVAVW